MGSGVSVGGVVGVFGAFVQVTVLSDLGEEEPEEDHADNALVHGLGDHVPHLVVEAMDLLQALQVALSCWCVGQGPHT